MILIHPGLPKCGSTTLQAGLFSQHPDLLLFRVHLKDQARSDITSDVINPIVNNPSFFDKERAFDAVRNLELLSAAYQRIPVLSCEGLTSTRFIGIEKKTARLAQIFSLKETKILLVFRNPINLVRSTFYQWLLYDDRRGSEKVDINKWLHNMIEDFENRDHNHTNFLNSLNYFDIWRGYLKFFGRKRVLPTTLENLANNENSFYSEICDFCNIKKILPTKDLPSNVTSVKTLPEGLVVNDTLSVETITRLVDKFSNQFRQMEALLRLQFDA
jgi:hypothetical protein